ncbi:MAG: MMPL family transporter [Mycobacteriaceae bacterium]
MAVPAPRRRGLASGYAAFVVRARLAQLAVLAVLVWAALSFLPSLAATGSGLAALTGGNNAAITAQEQALQQFGLPLLARTAVVQRDPSGLDPYAEARAELRALTVDKHTLVEGTGGQVLAALAVPNSLYPFPGTGHEANTVVTYLFANPTVDMGGQNRAAHAYAAGIDHPGDHLLGVTGTIPLLEAQGGVVAQYLPWVEIASVLAVAIIVGLNFRSLIAPLVTLLTAGLGYVVADRVVGEAAVVFGFTAPAQLEPILVALVLGVTTDYSIFFLAGLQRRLRAGEDPHEATRNSVVQYLPTVVVAGLTVSASLFALLVAHTALFRELGPGLALTVLTGLVVAILLVPALLAVLGRWAFWPSRLCRRTPPEDPDGGNGAMLLGGDTAGRLTRLLTRRRSAALAAVGVIAVLGTAAWPLTQFHESISPMSALPTDNPVRVAWEGAAAGFSPGVLSPTEVVLNQPGITAKVPALRALQHQLQTEPGVSAVLGPADFTLPGPLRQHAGLFLAPGGDAARLLVIFDADPLGARAVESLRGLQQAMPGLQHSAGLPGAQISYAGDTALGLGLADSSRGDLGRVALTVALVDLVLLMVFLRALIAPLYLLVASFLTVAATLGLTTWLFHDFLGQDGLVFYVPFAAGVLLVSLGSDYNIFSVGSIWAAAAHRDLPDALGVAVPRSSRAIGAAGITLATSFGFVALIPVAPFQELAFAMGVGVLLDAFLVRSVLVPSLITLVGRFSGWPGHRLRRPPARAGHEPLATDPRATEYPPDGPRTRGGARPA